MSQNTREMIIVAAVKIIKEDGYSKVTMLSLAKRLTISRQTIYTYFNSTEELFSQCQAEIGKDFAVFLYKNVDPASSSVDKVKNISRRFIAYAKEREHCYDFLFSFNPISNSLLPVATLHLIFQGLVEEAFPSRRKKKGDVFFLTLFSFVHGYAALLRKGDIQHDDAAFDRIIEKLLIEF